jgi:hypothetical protein
MAGFDEALAKARADKLASEKAKEKAVADAAARRDAIRVACRDAARAMLPELDKAIRALQASALSAEQHPDASVPWMKQHPGAQESWVVPLFAPGSFGKTSRFRGWKGGGTPKLTGWKVGVLMHVPRIGRPVFTRPASRSDEEPITLGAFIDEGHWSHYTVDKSTGIRKNSEWDAATTFKNAIEGIAQYLAILG